MHKIKKPQGANPANALFAEPTTKKDVKIMNLLNI
jgi:hypothetical protein